MAKKSRGMRRWLFKEEPSCYTFEQLESDGDTVWDGVRNNLARQNLREVRKGDRIFFYHSGKIRAVVGEMKAVSDAYSEDNDDDPKNVVVKVEFVKRWKKPVTLKQIKQEDSLLDWDLVRMSRLSIVPVTNEQWKTVTTLGR